MKNRTVIYSEEYKNFTKSLDNRSIEKLNYITAIIETSDVISAKFVKKLVNTVFYELRLSVANEIRIILFSVDDENINQSTQVVFLTGFVKKSTKDYAKQIEKAEAILNK